MPAASAMYAGIRTGKGVFPRAVVSPSTISRMVRGGPDTLYILTPVAGRVATARQARAASPLYSKLFRVWPSPTQMNDPLSRARNKRPILPGSPSPYRVAKRRIVSVIPNFCAISCARSSAFLFDKAYNPSGLQRASSLHRPLVNGPYTDTELIRTKCSTPILAAAETMLAVPISLTC